MGPGAGGRGRGLPGTQQHERRLKKKAREKRGFIKAKTQDHLV